MAPPDSLYAHAARASTDGGTKFRTAGRAGTPRFDSLEEAARYHLDHAFRTAGSPTFRSIAGSDAIASPAADMETVSERSLEKTDTTLVRFRQRYRDLRVFGGGAGVEVTGDGEFVSLNSYADSVSDIGDMLRPGRDPNEAFETVRRTTQVDISIDELGAKPELLLYRDPAPDAGAYPSHLAWRFSNVPALPTEAVQGSPGHRMAPRPYPARGDYLVDAHNGKLLYYYGTAPTADIPTTVFGLDTQGIRRELKGLNRANRFELIDPVRNVITLDLDHHDIGSRDPYTVIAEVAEFPPSMAEAVTAHFNATRVHDFLESVFHRDGIDGKGFAFTSVVNTVASNQQAPPQWHQAVWHPDDRRMYFGQAEVGGQLLSTARHLDVMAHEIMHGVSSFESQLAYRDESGALDESLADIFGVVVRNWYDADDRNDPATWNWEIGSSFYGDGRPLRHMADPSITGDPAHMNDYLETKDDLGGVHTNSNIHNQAAYRLLIGTDSEGITMPVEQVITAYYYTLLRLFETAGFLTAMEVLVGVIDTMWAGDETKRRALRNLAIRAYADVGVIAEQP